jgi:chromosome partitioning protein
VLDSVRARGSTERPPARSSPRVPITRAADLVGRTSASIRDAEKDGHLPAVERTASGRRVAYSLAEINKMREVFGTRPWRTEEDPLTVIAVQNFKGGVGKSTVASHLAQYLAIKGYRVCPIDRPWRRAIGASLRVSQERSRRQQVGHACRLAQVCWWIARTVSLS